MGGANQDGNDKEPTFVIKNIEDMEKYFQMLYKEYKELQYEVRVLHRRISNIRNQFLDHDNQRRQARVNPFSHPRRPRKTGSK